MGFWTHSLSDGFPDKPRGQSGRAHVGFGAKPPNQQGNTELMLNDREVGRRLPVPAVNHAAGDATVRAAGTASATICKNDKGAAAATLDLKHAAFRKERKLLHAPSMRAVPSLPATATRTVHAKCARATEPGQDHQEVIARNIHADNTVAKSFVWTKPVDTIFAKLDPLPVPSESVCSLRALRRVGPPQLLY